MEQDNSRLDTWNPQVHALWESGKHDFAVQELVREINANAASARPAQGRLEQLSYYAFVKGDMAGVKALLQKVLEIEPTKVSAKRNLAVAHAMLGEFEPAVAIAREIVREIPTDIHALDILAAHCAQFNNPDEARAAGRLALRVRHEQAMARAPLIPNWSLPSVRIGAGQHALDTKVNVIAFSLWGAQPRYLRGALRNVLVAPTLFPGWTLRFYIDASVPEPFVAILRDLGAQVMLLNRPSSTLRERLSWRFLVANDPLVGYFLVRDADSCLSMREAISVSKWLDGGAHFHVMRDWWSHTELILAGMWGGVAGVLPPIGEMLLAYEPSELETRNIDQRFLREMVWPLIHASTCVHDRYFSTDLAEVFPGGIPQGDFHVGQDEYSARPAQQADQLRSWLNTYPWL